MATLETTGVIATTAGPEYPVASTDRCSYEQRLAGIERSKRHMTVIAIGAGQVQPVVGCFGFPPAGGLLRVGFAALVWKPRAHQHRGGSKPNFIWCVKVAFLRHQTTPHQKQRRQGAGLGGCGAVS